MAYFALSYSNDREENLEKARKQKLKPLKTSKGRVPRT